jgi:hypothetical protein
MTWEPFLAAGTILTIALGVGLVCAAVGLTAAVLWHYLSEGYQLAVLRAWEHLKGTAELYFRRIRWYGHTHKSTWTAVACSLVIWLGIGVSFKLTAYWQTCLVVLLALPLAFLAVGWWLRGPRASEHRFRFVCSFFEPVIALAVPSLAGKVVEMVISTLVASI